MGNPLSTKEEQRHRLAAVTKPGMSNSFSVFFPVLLHSTVFCSVLLCLLCSTPLCLLYGYSALLYYSVSILLYCTLLYCILFCIYSTFLYSALLYFNLFCFCSTLFYWTLLCSIPLYSALLWVSVCLCLLLVCLLRHSPSSSGHNMSAILILQHMLLYFIHNAIHTVLDPDTLLPAHKLTASCLTLAFHVVPSGTLFMESQ